MKTFTLTLLASAILAGCSSFPANYDKLEKVPNMVQEKSDEWSNLPAVTFVQSTTGVVVRKYNLVPERLRDQRVSLSVNGNLQLTLSELAKVLSTQGLRVSAALLSEENRKSVWDGRQFEGTLGELLEQLTAQYNIAVEHRSGMTYLVDANRFSAALPQHKEFLEQVATALGEMGAKEVRTDVLAGQVYYVAKPNVADYVEEYLTSIAKNSAMVTLQVAVLTVGMNRDVNLGFDWAKLAVQRGSGPMRADVGSILKSSTSMTPTVNTGTGATTGTNTGTNNGTTTSNNTNGTNTSTNTGTAANTVAAVQSVLTGSMLSFAGTEGFGYKFANNAFSMTAALKALSTYGNARTEQNVVLGTLSGVPVKISSGNDIPYIKSIGSATAAGGATSGTSQTDVIKSGLSLDLVPNFDAADGTVTTSIKVDMSTLVAFRELSAGQNLGTLSQPEMQKLGFENVGRINAGETIIVGGITYDQVSNNYTNFPGMEEAPTGSKAQKVNRNAIYIVVRPTVVIFTPQAQELTAKLKAAEAEAERLNRKVQNESKSSDAMRSTLEPTKKPKAVEVSPAAEVRPAVSVAPTASVAPASGAPVISEPQGAPTAEPVALAPELGLGAGEELVGVTTQGTPPAAIESREVTQ